MPNGLYALDERAAFKPIANGYVFRAPSRWLMGPAQYYLVDQPQKDEIADALAHIRVQRANTFIVLVAAVLIGLAISTNFREHLWLAAAFGFTALVAFVAMTRFRQFSALQPMVARLPHTAERITWRDRLTTAAAATSFAHLLILGISFAVIGLASVLELGQLLARADGGGSSMRLVATATEFVLFTSMAAADFALVVFKLRNPRRVAQHGR